jgi:aminopeptidase N/puromycin-sensitive aminopeptidase
MTVPRILSILVALAAALPFIANVVSAQRLPAVARPVHYSLWLTPDLVSATFSGDETIDLVLTEPQQSITLNAFEIAFQSVTVNPNGRELKAAVSEDTAKQQATFVFPDKLPAGKIALRIRYTGVLNNELRGFYLSKTAKRNYAVTQFEATDARRAFPCFDEPAFKATFDIALTVDTRDTVISNTNAISDQPGSAPDKHTVKFATTPKMSTYLVVFLVGDFQCISGSSDSVPIRTCATPDKVDQGSFALKAAEYFLHYYDAYFGIKYPMPKLDMIAIPDFEAGAMENFGAITYREIDMLIDEKTASLGTMKNVAEDVAHELAHQWFGDMVTMQWWDNVWLNEGFATWMSSKPVAAWRPEWNVPEDRISSLDNVLNLDAGVTTRTIRAQAETPDQINEMFDGISYQKAGAVLGMVENLVGKETFRRGVHEYLAAHLYGNATAEDFWSAQTTISNQPVDKIMQSFVDQPGEPGLTFSSPKNSAIEVKQKRFFLSPTAKANTDESWTIPVCIKGRGSSYKCEVLSSKQHSLPTQDSTLLFANAGGLGYYRSIYPEDGYRTLFANVETDLTAEERISLLGDEWAIMRANKIPVGSYLDLVAAVKDDSSGIVLGSALKGVQVVNARIAASEMERTGLAAWVRQTFRGALQRLGPAASDDPPEKKELRSALYWTLGTVGNDPDIVAQAKAVAKKYLADPPSVDGTFAETASDLAAVNGDAAYFDELLKVYETSSNLELQQSSLRRLALFSDPQLEKRALDYIVSDKVRNQDSPLLLAAEFRGRQTRDLAWQFTQQSWDKVRSQLTTSSGGSLVVAAGNFCSVEDRDNVTAFYATHHVPSSERALKLAADQINGCIELRRDQEPKLKEWLAQHQ